MQKTYYIELVFLIMDTITAFPDGTVFTVSSLAEELEPSLDKRETMLLRKRIRKALMFLEDKRDFVSHEKKKTKTKTIVHIYKMNKTA